MYKKLIFAFFALCISETHTYLPFPSYGTIKTNDDFTENITSGCDTITTCSGLERKKWFEEKRELVREYVNAHFPTKGFLDSKVYSNQFVCSNYPYICCVANGRSIIGFVIYYNKQCIVITSRYPEKYSIIGNIPQESFTPHTTHYSTDWICKKCIFFHGFIDLCNDAISYQSTSRTVLDYSWPAVAGLAGGIIYYYMPEIEKNLKVSVCGGIAYTALLYWASISIRNEIKQEIGKYKIETYD